MKTLKYYMQDGANRQARAVLCLLQDMTIEESWSPERQEYSAETTVARWENCREQGYVVSLRAENGKTLHVAWFEHRNSDSICALKWEQNCWPNSPNIDTADFGGACYKDKWDVSHQVGPDQCGPMADWISGELQAWWNANRKELQPTQP